jgi:hypothetical protein
MCAVVKRALLADGCVEGVAERRLVVGEHDLSLGCDVHTLTVVDVLDGRVAVADTVWETMSASKRAAAQLAHPVHRYLFG